MYSRTTQSDTFGIFVTGRGLRLMFGTNYDNKVIVPVPLSKALQLRQLSNNQNLTIQGSMSEGGQWINYEITFSPQGVVYSDSMNRVFTVSWVENELEIIREIAQHVIILSGFHAAIEQLSWYMQNPPQPRQTQQYQPQQPQQIAQTQQPVQQPYSQPVTRPQTITPPTPPRQPVQQPQQNIQQSTQQAQTTGQTTNQGQQANQQPTQPTPPTSDSDIPF